MSVNIILLEGSGFIVIRARIVGTGGFLPEDVLTNKDIEKFCDTSDEWIRKRTGIEQRHVAKDGVGASVLGTEAAKLAIDRAGVSPSEIDAIVCCTVTPDQVSPSTATTIQANLGIDGAASFDINAACSGFVYGLAVANGLMQSGLYRTMLLVGAETTSRLLNWEFRDTAVLFADGAGAVVLRADETDHGVLSMFLGADGSDPSILSLPEGGFRHKPTPEHLAAHPMHIVMNGPELFKRAVLKFEEASLIALERASLKVEDVDLFVPHQANGRIIDAARKRAGLSEDSVVMNLDRTGNTVAASIPLALHEADRQGRLKPGDIVLFAAFGAGLTWGASVVRW